MLRYRFLVLIKCEKLRHPGSVHAQTTRRDAESTQLLHFPLMILILAPWRAVLLERDF